MTKNPGDKSPPGFLSWLRYENLPDWTRASWLGALVGVIGALIALDVLILAIGALIRTNQHVLSSTSAEYNVRDAALAIAAIIGLPFVFWRAMIAQRQTNISEEGLITDRINKAVEHLGAEKTVHRMVPGADGKEAPVTLSEPNLEVRLGGLYALERIAEDSLRDHIQIMEILCAYIRENTKLPRIDEDATQKALKDAAEELEAASEADRENLEASLTHYHLPRADIQAALTILGSRAADRLTHEATHREGRPYKLDLRAANLQRADLTKARLGPALLNGTGLQCAILRGANLKEANLWGANLKEAELRGANLKEAELRGANLQEAYLRYANLQEAILWGANLKAAKLWGANLRAAYLWGANLKEAYLRYANLKEAELEGANLQEARLGGARLKEANLRYANLKEAELEGANLQEADLRGANLQSAEMRNCSMAHTFLRSADFTNCQALEQDQVNSSFGVASGIGVTRLPSNLAAPPHWHKAEDRTEDNDVAKIAACEAYEHWLQTAPKP